MSINTWIAESDSNKFRKSYINGFIDVSQNIISRNGNIYLLSSSPSINSTNNIITFDDTYQYTNFSNNVHILGVSLVDYNGNTYDVGYQISNILNNLIGSMSYYQPSDFNLFNNTFCQGQIQFQDSIGNHIDAVPFFIKLNNGDYIDKTITNSFTLQQNFSSIRLDGGLLLNNGLTTLSNADLQKVSLINTLSSNAQTQLSALQTKTTNQTFATTTTTFSGTLASSILTFSTSINTIPAATFAFINSLSSNAQTQLTTNATNITTANTNITALQTKTTQITYISATTTTTFGGSTVVLPYTQCTSSLRIDGALLLNSGLLNIPKTTLESIQYLSGVSSNINTSISNLNTKTTDITFATSTTTIANTTACNNLTFSGQFNGVFKANFDTAISRITTLLSPAQTQIDSKVSLTGAETIDGIKTFSSPPVMSGASITAGTIPNSALVSSGFVDLSTSQNILTGTKSWTAQQNFLSNIRVDGSLILNGGSLTLSNSVLQFMSGLSSNAQTQFNNLSSNVTDINQKLTNIAYTSASNTTFVNSILSTYTLVFSNTLNGINTTTFGFLSGLSSNAQTQFNNLSSNVVDINQKLSNIAYTTGTTYVSSTLSASSFNASTISFTSAINTISTSTFAFLQGLTSNIQTQINNLSSRLTTVEEIKIGSVIHCLIVGESTSWKYCNGQTLSRTTYSALFALISTTYGTGDGSTTFNLPNFDGLFIRNNGGQTYGGISYASTSPGVIQQDSFQDHQHSGQSGGYLGTSNITQNLGGNSYATGVTKPASYSFSNTGFQTNGRGSTETRPINVSLVLLIKVL